MELRTRYQRGVVAVGLLRDLEARTTNQVIKEYCEIAVNLLSAPSHVRKQYERRALELYETARKRGTIK